MIDDALGTTMNTHAGAACALLAREGEALDEADRLHVRSVLAELARRAVASGDDVHIWIAIYRCWARELRWIAARAASVSTKLGISGAAETLHEMAETLSARVAGR